MSKNVMPRRSMALVSAALATVASIYGSSVRANDPITPSSTQPISLPKGWDSVETSVKPPQAAPVALEAQPVAATPIPNTSSDAFKARMSVINADPKTATKEDLIAFAGTYGVLVKKSWTKAQIIAALNAPTISQ